MQSPKVAVILSFIQLLGGGRFTPCDSKSDPVQGMGEGLGIVRSEWLPIGSSPQDTAPAVLG